MPVHPTGVTVDIVVVLAIVSCSKNWGNKNGAHRIKPHESNGHTHDKIFVLSCLTYQSLAKPDESTS